MENSYKLLAIILARNQIRDMLGGEIGKITFGKLSKFRKSSEKNSKLVQYIGTLGGRGF